MLCENPACLGKYDFVQICNFAIQRFVEGQDTIEMIINAKSAKEVEEICMVSLLDVEDNIITTLNLSCRRVNCLVTSCREQLRELIADELNYKKVMF